MLRSMYSGVSGMKAHQAKMDVIGNNIANVNTYGFKSSRATFRDIYYQTLSGASEATGTRGGTNPSQIGYGSKIGSVDVMQTRSAFQMTDNGMDCAIAGEGFFQVQDTAGNTFYTRAGMLNIDSAGNLVDMNGNFVLGVSGNPLGKKAGSEKIQVSIPSVSPTPASIEEMINNVKVSITASNANEAGNVAINIISDNELPLGEKVVVKEDEVSTNGITVRLNANETFGSITELNNLINEAIKKGNGGKDHPGGTFTISADKNLGFPLLGAELTGKNYAATPGSIKGFAGGDFGGFSFDNKCTTSSGFTVGASAKVDTFTSTYSDTDQAFQVTMTIDGKDYKGMIGKNVTNPGQIVLKESGGQSVTINHPGFDALEKNALAISGKTALADGNTALDDAAVGTAIAGTSVAGTIPSKDCGLSSKPFKLAGGTEGGTQTVADLSSIAIGADGIIEAIHPVSGRIQVGRIDLVTFENPQGLQQAGNTYFTATANSGKLNYAEPGASGSGQLAAGSLEMSNVDLSREFADMITTQRGFQANSRLITVSDEILNELVNLKR